MKSPTNQPYRSITKPIILIVSALIIVGGGWWVVFRPAPLPSRRLATQVAPVVAATNPSAQTSLVITKAAKPPTAKAGVLRNYPDFRDRPFSVAYESPAVEWTLADGKDTNIIRQLAHNHLEYDRMVEENPRIFRRQLVYLKETPAAVFEQAKLTGLPVHQLTLPGVDGQELQFEIVKSEGDGSSRQGMFSGHLAGNVDSLVTLAFTDGREAYTVLSPKDDIFVAGDPREDGQVIVKAIDPNTYGLGPEDADDHVVTVPTKK